MMHKAFGLMLICAAATPAMAFEEQTYSCRVDEFVDDSRYPSEDPNFEADNGQKRFAIFDAGDRVLVEVTTLDDDLIAYQVPVVERMAASLLAEIAEGSARTSLALQFADGEAHSREITGTFTTRTYEVDQTWTLRCEGVETE
jgi:hypothetical protein